MRSILNCDEYGDAPWLNFVSRRFCACFSFCLSDDLLPRRRRWRSCWRKWWGCFYITVPFILPIIHGTAIIQIWLTKSLRTVLDSHLFIPQLRFSKVGFKSTAQTSVHFLSQMLSTVQVSLFPAFISRVQSHFFMSNKVWRTTRRCLMWTVRTLKA